MAFSSQSVLIILLSLKLKFHLLPAIARLVPNALSIHHLRYRPLHCLYVIQCIYIWATRRRTNALVIILSQISRRRRLLYPRLPTVTATRCLRSRRAVQRRRRDLHPMVGRHRRRGGYFLHFLFLFANSPII